MCEHQGISFLTGSKLSDPKSSVFDHCLDTGHQINDDSFEILGGCRPEENILMLESVYIKYHRPDLNNMDSAYPLQLTLSRFLHSIPSPSFSLTSFPVVFFNFSHVCCLTAVNFAQLIVFLHFWLVFISFQCYFEYYYIYLPLLVSGFIFPGIMLLLYSLFRCYCTGLM